MARASFLIPSAACGAALVLTVALTGCDSHLNGGSGKGDKAGASSSASESASPTPSESKSSAPPPITAAEYRSALAKSVGPVNTALAKLPKARTIGQIDSALSAVESAAGTAADDLETARTPPDAATEHAGLVRSLRDLATDLGQVQSDEHDHKLCATSSVLASAGKTASWRTGVPDARKALTAKGYALTLNLPGTPRERTRRLSTGHLVKDSYRGGRGILTIDNGGSDDAVVTLTRGGRTAFSVYVRKSGTAKVRSISDGTYRMYFTTGSDWDSGSRSFTRDCSFSKFDDTAKYRTTRTSSAIYYSTFRITLQPVIGGNASTSSVDPNSFPH